MYILATCSALKSRFLSEFYLTVPGKKAVALVGINGSGKSSIIPLMERFYDPSLEVLLDSENIKNLKQEWLRNQIGLVTQEPALLSLEIGYDTPVGRASMMMTEEHKIKLYVARAVLSNPYIRLLDEVTGGLDFEAERSVQEALDVLMLATKLPRRMPMRIYKESSALQVQKDSSAGRIFQEPSSPLEWSSHHLSREFLEAIQFDQLMLVIALKNLHKFLVHPWKK
ncbi:ABC-type xenobiotic transporter [Salvia divinorum]|uniref:ABC-type xenobiotic transporter n=1 Tax=Salvia divinorum TaxID=28513 RepID=A0ABD1HTZ1_SALDI